MRLPRLLGAIGWASLVLAVLAPDVALAMGPQEFARQLRMAQRHVQRGELTLAVRLYERLSREDPTNERVVRGYASALRQSGRFEDALGVYERADAEHPSPRFLVERVTLLKQLDRQNDAVSLCLDNLNAPRSMRQFVRDELLALVSDRTLWQRAYEDLKLRVSRGPATDAVSTALAEVCLEGRRFEEAVSVTRTLDHALGANGVRLVSVAKRLEVLGQHELALEVVREVVPEIQNAEARREAALFEAQLEEKLGSPEDAYDGLTWLVESDPDDRHVYEIHMKRAELLSGPLDRADEAIGIYDELLERETNVAIDERVRLARAETQLVLRRYDGALADCRNLASTSRKEHVRERASFMVGEIFFYQGEIDSAAAAYGVQVETFPAGLLTNDGLDRLFLFNENYGDDGVALVEMGRLHELATEGELSAALALGDSLITRYADAPVHDDLLLYVAGLLAKSDAPARAYVHLDALGQTYPDSRLAPRGLKLHGELLEGHAEDASAALAKYEDLLIRYPLSIEASEVRPRVTRLRQEVRS